jgi:DNA-binding transcriptional regulator YdaS (Cro superfamily)
MDLKTYCDQERGRQAALAAAIRVPPVSISNWAAKKRPVPLPHVLPIERATRGCVTRQELRPADWHMYWPKEGDDESMPPISASGPATVVAIAQGGQELGDQARGCEERAAA